MRDDIKDKMAQMAAGAIHVAKYRIADREVTYRTVDELKALFKLTFELESMDGIDSSTRVSYGRHRRFR